MLVQIGNLFQKLGLNNSRTVLDLLAGKIIPVLSYKGHWSEQLLSFQTRGYWGSIIYYVFIYTSVLFPLFWIQKSLEAKSPYSMFPIKHTVFLYVL